MTAVDFIYDDDCPNVDAARANLKEAFLVARLPPSWSEHRIGDPSVPDRARGFGSPTILVDGKDVAGQEPSAEQSCRIYATGGGVPSAELVVAALTAASKGEPPRGGGRFGWRRSSFALLPAVGAALLPNVACPACWPAYAGFLGSLGLGFVMDSAWLLPITAAGLAVALGALAFRARMRRGYGPFIAGLVASAVVLLGKFNVDSEVLTYLGIGLLMAASIWNSWPRRVTAGTCSPCATK